MSLRIGVVSDTHVPDRQREIPKALLLGLEGVALVIHAGDLTDLRVLDILNKIAPVHAVCGNMDSSAVKSSLERTITLKILDKTLNVFHGAASHGATVDAARTMFPGSDCVIFGHTHESLCAREGEMLLFNPGAACGSFWSGPSYGILTLTEGRPVEGRIIQV